MLFIFIYSILGVYLFAEVMHNGAVFENANFENLGLAFLTLIRIMTADTWHLIMHALSRGESILFQCIEDPTYEDYV